MPLKPEEIKRRIHAARLLRDLSQKDLDRLGQADGFGDVEMGRVERGELEFRPGKHLDPLCRYLRVPRWWFTLEELDFGAIDAPASVDEVASLLAQQNMLLARQSEILQKIEGAVDREAAAARQLLSEGEAWADAALSRYQEALRSETGSPAPKQTARAKSRSLEG